MNKNNNIEDAYPLSPMQQGMLFHSIYAPEAGVYIGQIHFELRGQLNTAALIQAWEKVIQRHSVLRTSCVWKNLQQPIQVVVRQVKIPWQQQDWREISLTQQQEKLKALLEEDIHKDFEFSKAPLIRLTLIRVSETNYHFIWTYHLLLFDGWSLPLLYKEVFSYYQAFCQGQDLYLEKPRPYKDYISWLQQQNLYDSEVFWRKMLKNCTVTSFLNNKKQLSEQKESYTKQSVQLSATTTDLLYFLGREYQLTLNTLVQGAWVLLLSKYIGEEDIIFGVTVSGRPHTLSQANSIIGLFINTLPVRVKINYQQALITWLKQIQEQQIEARQYEYTPLVDIQRWSEIPANISLFETIVVFENYPEAKISKESELNLEIKVCDRFERNNYPLTLIAIPGNELLLEIAYEESKDIDASTVCRMLGHLEALLKSMAVNIKKRLKELSILTQSERQQLLVEWNNTEVKYPQQQCVHELFEAQVESTPDAVAVVFEDEQLTYRELNTRANQLADYLQQLGVKPEVLVGICVERSLCMIIGLLAILKAGGAYVPIDPANPPERLAFILSDTAVSVLLTQQHLIENLPQHQTRVVCLDTDWENIAQQSSQNPIHESTTDNLAYIIYTSGSTGQPKGVLVNHSNVVRLLAATECWYNFNQDDVWTLFHSIAFDFSVWEIWGALLYGGQLVVVPYWLSRSPEDFYQLLLRQQVTVLNQTPSAFRQLIQVEESLEKSNNLSLRKVIFGGEALQIESLRPWFERHGDQSPQLINMYGITETTVHVTYRPLTMADLEVASASLIGRPIGDLQVYLLDMYGQPVPIGVPGEMYIGGAGVVRGYLNRPELTPVRFIPNLFNNKPGTRLYKSGDQARYLPNGDIEYLGRIDHQVKIRGFRIELGEIEAALSQHSAVRETVVVVRDDSADSQRIVAYVVPQKEQTLTISQLRSFLESKLPNYMLPAAFVTLEMLPLTSNGKIDRKALPIPDTARPELEEVFVAPSTKEEEILVDIWAKVLGIKQVGIHDNFFSLGGDSIRSIQVQSLAQKHGLNFSIQQIFQHQTIYHLAQNLTKLKAKTPLTKQLQPFDLICEEDRLKLTENIQDAYPITMLQMGMFFHNEYDLESTVYHNVCSYHLRAPFNLQHFQTTLQQLADRHSILRTSFDLGNFKEPLQLVHKVVHIPLQVENICHLSPKEQEELLAAWFESEKHLPFESKKAPLIRFCIHRRSQETFQFSFTEHHAILDGWSVASLITELFGYYFSKLSKEVHPIEPHLVSNFRDFVALEREVIKSDACQHYWTKKLSDSTTTVLSPWSTKYDKDSLPEISTYEVPISLEVSDGLNQLARSLRVPIKSVLLAAHMRVLSLLSGQSDVVTGLVCNGRPEETDGERVIGLFLNTLPYRLQLLGGTWIDLVNKTFEVEQELIPFRRYPLAELQRVLGRQSLFETAFNFTNFHVYKNLSNTSIEILDGKSFSPTNFSFLAEFEQGSFSSQVSLHLSYDNTVFFEQQIRAIGGYYANTLTTMASKPKGCYKSHVLLSAEEQNQLLVEWNDTQTEYPIDRCIHQFFEAQVELTPDAVAVVFEDKQLTYQELNARANQLANYLRSLGVKPEVLVGICVERSLDMVIGLLAILKAGGAYVPLDPLYPKERLAFMLEDTQVSVLLTQQRLVEQLPEHKARVVCLDEDWKDIAHVNQENLNSGVTIANLAYVIYTSGSTGKPKGIGLPQRSLINLLQWHFSSLLNGVRTLQFASLSFDASFHEMFATWGTGGTLFILPENLRIDAVGLGRFLSDQAIEKVILPVVVLQLLAELVDEKGVAPLHTGFLNTLREITTTGEQLQITQPIIKLFKSLEHCSLHNHYGPSETHVVTALSLENNPDEWSFHPPIGRPIANTEIYIVDQQFNIVPLGVTGELYIGGVSLAQGYLNRPDLTAEKFIPNPFSDKPSARLYKTGDLARYQPDGNVEYLGRIDHQVKIRGFRIELGEIEAVLSHHPAVREVVVLDQRDEAGNKRLVAYVVSDQESTSISSELRYFLDEKLPSYMVPSAFIFLGTLPLTPNGKVDRRALPVPDLTRPDLERTFVAPRTTAEEIVAEIWKQVLGIEKVGIHDNFFELGGHSLITTQVISRIRQVFQIELPIRSLFKSPTVESLVDAIAQIWGTQEVVEEIARTWKELEKIPAHDVKTMLLREEIEIKG